MASSSDQADECVTAPYLVALGITRAQYEDLIKFKNNVKDLLTPERDDFYLVRWFRARGYDVVEAEIMIRKSMEWRERWGADTILTDFKCLDVLKHYDIGGCCGYDKQGFPVWIYKTVLLDVKGLRCSVSRNEILKKYIYKMESCFEDMKQQSKKLGRPVNKAVIINDLEGFTVSHLFQPGLDVILKIFAMVESNYPETLRCAYVINAPRIFPLILKMCKPFMHEETRKRIIMLGSNWREKLLEVIDADQLPVHWGGTKLDPVNGDPYCSSMIRMGGPVPRDCYKTGPDLVDESKINKINVNAGRVVDLELTVEKANVELRYTFWTDDYNIKFGVYRKKDHGEPTEVVRLQKYNSHQIPEVGVLRCEKPASYLLRFDNSYSWIHSKEVSYVIEIGDPDSSSTHTP